MALLLLVSRAIRKHGAAVPDVTVDCTVIRTRVGGPARYGRQPRERSRPHGWKGAGSGRDKHSVAVRCTTVATHTQSRCCAPKLRTGRAHHNPCHRGNIVRYCHCAMREERLAEQGRGEDLMAVVVGTVGREKGESLDAHVGSIKIAPVSFLLSVARTVYTHALSVDHDKANLTASVRNEISRFGRFALGESVGPLFTQMTPSADSAGTREQWHMNTAAQPESAPIHPAQNCDGHASDWSFQLSTLADIE